MATEKEMLSTIASAFCAIRNAYEYESMVRLGMTERAVKASMEILAWKEKAHRILKEHSTPENETLKCSDSVGLLKKSDEMERLHGLHDLKKQQT